MKNKFLKLVISLIIIFILVITLIIFLNKKIMPIYLNYAEGEIESLATTVINKSITSSLTTEFDSNNLFIIKNDSSGTTLVDFDPVIINKVMSDIADIVYDNLKDISKKRKELLKKYNIDSSIFYVPSGIIFDSVVLNNLGPRIPINMELVSSVNPNIETRVSEYGINNSLIEVFIKVRASIKMYLPTASKTIKVEVVVPVAIKLIQGKVPEYYFGTKKTS